MRGTAATNFIRAGLPLEDVATILRWERDRVEQVAMKYVTGQEVGRAIVERMKRNERSTQSVNRPVNRDRFRGRVLI